MSIETNESGWANFSAFDQQIEPAANPLLVSSQNPSNALPDSGSCTSKLQSEISGPEDSDNLLNHKPEAAQALKDSIQAVKNSEIVGSDERDTAAVNET